MKLFLDRKIVEPVCMRGYLLAQVEGERSPSVVCYVLERPPAGNAPYSSAIPTGTYPVHVKKDGHLGWRLELEQGPERTNVQIHIGNFPSDTVGCLLPGTGTFPTACVVHNSAAAMVQLKILFAAFGDDGVTELRIQDIG
jgi:hypothetical protein